MKVKNVQMVEFPRVTDERGSLCFCESGKQVRFNLKRVFWIFDTPKGAVRGHHAHKRGWQVHICLGGSATIMLDDGKNKQKVVIKKPNSGLIIGPMVWHSFKMEKGAHFFVISSNKYSEKDYIRDYDKFKRLAK